tara:strand:- start:265 stop:1149 length:885 start_codon:yes stop_codon:yes gene_type:complete
MSAMNKTVIVTGASSGFGKLTAKTLFKSGLNVVATMREVSGRNEQVASELKSLGPKLNVYELDVADTASVNTAAAKILSDHGAVDVVINNAGIGVRGLQEAFSVEDMQKVFEVNVYGPQRVNRAFLPSMRSKGDGLLIQLSSTVGRFIVPYCGPYAMSKYAVEAMAESYRYELASTGVDSVIVEPGGFMTNFAGTAKWAEVPSENIGYEKAAPVIKKMWGEIIDYLESDEGPNPQLVADAILKLIETPKGERPLRTIVDTGDVSVIERMNKDVQALALRTMESLGLVGETGTTP